MRYNNYHKHTHYSNIRTLDCIVKPEEYCKRAQELGHITYFTGEHGFQGNIYEAYTLCDKYGLKCVYSVEAYYVKDMFNKDDRRSFHIMLIAMTNNARKEINKILSKANVDGFYYKPRIDLDCLLSLNPDETIITTACIASPMFKDNWEEDFFIPVYNHFKKNLYLEVQCHNDVKQIEYNKKILEVKEKYNVQLIHGNDSHYIKEEDSKYRDLFLKAKGIEYEEEDGFVLDYPNSDTIIKRYEQQGILNKEQVLEALNNTLVFDDAEPIDLNKEFKIPKATNNDSNEVLKALIKEAWEKECKNVPQERWPEYKEAIRYEVGMIEKCGMADYFILDHKIVNKATEEYDAVLTRTGRGSGVSFYVNYLLGLTAVDRLASPITLYPTRFMSDTRILESRSLPDIDLNWADVAPVIQASKDILGDDGVYYMIAYKPLQESSAFRLWCKAHDYDINDYDDIAKNLESNIDNPQWKDLIEQSKIFRGVIESVAPSPCSFLLLDKPISEEVGLLRVGGDKSFEMCCAMDGYQCDQWKYLKNDYLTVSVWDIIDRVYKLIGRPIDNIPTLLSNLDDKVWDLYEKGLTTTINQADSDFAKPLLKRYKPKSLAELSAFVAGIRPGFASLLDNFLDRKPYSTGVEELDLVLEDSFHYMMYQESIMKFLVWLGMEEKGTYDIIKKISKKKFKPDELAELHKQLEEGWVNKVGKIDGFKETWQVIEDAVRYSFNASHSLCVALDSLYGAYLKSHYPLEYFTVALSMYSGDMDRTSNLADELSYFGIKLNGIKFGKSSSDYTMDKATNSIYKGIASIKYCNDTIAEELLTISSRHYNSFIDLLEAINTETSVNSRQLDILIGLNFFSDYGKNKYLSQVVNVYNKFANAKLINKKDLDKLSQEYGLSEYHMQKYSGKETKSQWRELDNAGLIAELCAKIPNKPMPLKEQIQFEKENLGYVDIKVNNAPSYYWICIEMKTYNDKNKPYLTLRNLKSGETVRTRIKQGKTFKENPFNEFDILIFDDFSWQHKIKKIDNEWIETDQIEPILSCYDVVRK